MHDQATGMREAARAYAEGARPAPPYVLTVTSGKGGVGKSTVALNIGLTLSMAGSQVVLFDADGNLAGLDVMAGVMPRFRLGDVLRGDQDLESVLITLAPGLQLLPGSSGEPHYPLLQEEQQETLLSDLRHRDRRTDVVIIDTAAGLTPEIIRYGEAADSVLVVTTPEPTAVMDAYAMIKVLGMTAPGQRVELVINNVRSPREGEETMAKLRAAARHFLGRDVHCAGIIPHDEHAGEAIRRQEPLISAFPRSAGSLSLQSLGYALMHDHVEGSLKRTVAP
jgi:flagellar biosynthesis protein FlhG